MRIANTETTPKTTSTGRCVTSAMPGVVVNHNQNTKYLKNSNPKYFIGSCLKK